MARYLGVVTIIQNTTVLATMEGASIDTGGIEREEVKANGRTVGFFRKVATPMISCKAAVDPDFDAEAINAMEDGVVVFLGDNGVSFQLGGAFTSKPVKITDNNGGAECEFKGLEVINLG